MSKKDKVFSVVLCFGNLPIIRQHVAKSKKAALDWAWKTYDKLATASEEDRKTVKLFLEIHMDTEEEDLQEWYPWYGACDFRMSFIPMELE